MLHGGIDVLDEPWLTCLATEDDLKLVQDRAKYLDDLRRGGVLLEEESKQIEDKVNKLEAWVRLVRFHHALIDKDVFVKDSVFQGFKSELSLDAEFAIVTRNGDKLLLDIAKHEAVLFERRGQTRLLQANHSEGRFVYRAQVLGSEPRQVVLKKVSKQVLEHKSAEKQASLVHALRQEFISLAILEKFGQDNILFFENYFENNTCIFVTFPCARMSFWQMIACGDAHRLNSMTICSLFLQILRAVCFLANIGFSHRDLKLENFVYNVTPGGFLHAQLIDFGMCTTLPLLDKQTGKWGKISGLMGTHAYMAPEVFLNVDPYDAVQADVWSFGVSLFTFVCLGHLPYTYPGLGDLKYARLHQYGAKNLLRYLIQVHNYPTHRELSSDILNVIDVSMVVNTDVRIGVHDMLENLESVVNQL
mmetsp:Transcript_8971/g.16850  ORF Transcript_8971/g.16850 Transcript_8971/m.16850 type:complete len:418 (+) Transcript_8971:39-1292(+)